MSEVGQRDRHAGLWSVGAIIEEGGVCADFGYFVIPGFLSLPLRLSFLFTFSFRFFPFCSFLDMDVDVLIVDTINTDIATCHY